MTNNDAAWYEAMAKAMKEREKCLNAIKRWEVSLAQAESIIAQLAAKREIPEVEVSEEDAPIIDVQEELLG